MKTTALKFSSVSCSAIQCNQVQHSATKCNTVQYSAKQCKTVHYKPNTVQYSALQTKYNALHCNTVHSLRARHGEFWFGTFHPEPPAVEVLGQGRDSYSPWLQSPQSAPVVFFFKMKICIWISMTKLTHKKTVCKSLLGILGLFAVIYSEVQGS